jgi:flagellar motor switch protein FliG
MGESRTSTALPNATSESRAEAMHNTLAEREEALRRVAVVLSSLPASTASTLLDKVDGYSRHIVTQAITTLHTVPAKERRDILDSFKLGMSGKSQSEPRKEHSAGSPSAASLQQVAEGIQDEFVSTDSDESNVITARDAGRYGESMAAFFPSKATGVHQPGADSATPFEFLKEVSIKEMVALLSGEHPQTIALVLSSIAPKTAADVLPQLSSAIQKETLGRIGRLNDVPDSTLAEVGRHLHSRYIESVGAASESSGTRALQAIMAEMPACLPEAKSEAERPVTSTSSGAGSIDSTPELRIAEGTESVAAPVEMPVGNVETEDSTSPSNVQQSIDLDTDLVDATHAHLIALSPKELVAALGRVSTRDALLTLCGLPSETAEAAIACLSRAKARGVRRGIDTLGPLQLREIDASKRAVALVSIGAGELNDPTAYSRAA